MIVVAAAAFSFPWPVGSPTISHYQRLERATPLVLPLRVLFVSLASYVYSSWKPMTKKDRRFFVWYIWMYIMVPGAKVSEPGWVRPCRENPSRLRRFRNFLFILPLDETKREEEARELFVRNESLLRSNSIGGWFLSMQKYRGGSSSIGSLFSVFSISFRLGKKQQKACRRRKGASVANMYILLRGKRN